jgi:hypothetical protein
MGTKGVLNNYIDGFSLKAGYGGPQNKSAKIRATNGIIFQIYIADGTHSVARLPPVTKFLFHFITAEEGATKSL